MKTLLVLFCVLSFSVLQAQPGGGGGRPGGGPPGSSGMGDGERPEMVEFNAAKVAGIFNYDDDDAIKKLKIKKNEAELRLTVRKAIENYNKKVNDIALLNKDNFDTLNVYVNAKMKAMQASRRESGFRMESGERFTDSQDPDRALIQSKIDPAKTEVKAAEAKLNKDLEAVLSEKQYAKWMKYQAFIKEEQNPQPKSNRNGNSGMSRGGRQGGPPGGGMR
ncbi:hypothetical protein [Algibacter pacificus]|uniref:hypothetical protein n=1 Tax=Algibacter pacificus TaxID=2599389 RepID=UPI0011CC22ED|nr:hypothetical protein [Algibacter pacificus]